MLADWTFESSKILENLTGALGNIGLAIRHLEEAQKRGEGYFGEEIQQTRTAYLNLLAEVDSYSRSGKASAPPPLEEVPA